MTLSRRLHCVVLAGLFGSSLVLAQIPPPPSAPTPSASSVSAPTPPAAAMPSQGPEGGAPSVSTQLPARTAVPRPRAGKPEAQPLWSELTPAQQQSLAPLGASWRSLSGGQKAKWIALSANYPTLPPPEQQLLHSRMAEWAALSPQQRTLARLNFAESQKVAPADKKAKWEAYQALPPEEKRKLAAGAVAAKPPPPPTAPAVQPVPQQKLATIPRPKKADSSARIAVVPGQVDSNTLLPQPGLVPIQP